MKANNRNYAIDFIRVIAAFLMTAWHYILYQYQNYSWGDAPLCFNGYFGTYGWNLTGITEGWHYFKGTFTIGFFVFTTGYFIMDHFKKQQANGMYDTTEKRFSGVWKYTAKTYCSYLPLFLFGSAVGFIVYGCACSFLYGQNWSVMDWIQTFFWNIWKFLGVDGFGMFQNGSSMYVATFFATGWYIFGFIAWACVFYAILVKSERAAVYIWCPVAFAVSTIWLNEWLNLETASQTMQGIAYLVPQNIVRFWGPASFGVWGWYLVDAIKKADLSAKTEKILGALFVVSFVYVLVTSWTGYLGGMANQDAMWMIVAMFCLAQKDPVTRGINNFFQKLKISRYMADFSTGLYLCHVDLAIFVFPVIAPAIGIQKGAYIYHAITLVLALLYIVLAKFILKPLGNKLAVAVHAR